MKPGNTFEESELHPLRHIYRNQMIATVFGFKLRGSVFYAIAADGAIAHHIQQIDVLDAPEVGGDFQIRRIRGIVADKQGTVSVAQNCLSLPACRFTYLLGE